jgi:hypothetical protein
MLQQLDTAIAFVVVMLMLSLLVTAVVQVISALLDLRGKNLVRALSDLFNQIDPDLRGSIQLPLKEKIKNWLTRRRVTLATKLAESIATHPTLAHTFARAKAIRKDELLAVIKDLTSDKPAGKIDAAVLEKLKVAVAAQVPGGTGTADAAQAIADKLAIQFPAIKDDLKKAVTETMGQVSRLELGVEKWFDTVMDRASDIFTRWTRVITLVVSVLLVALLHIDAGLILRQISTSADIRAGLTKLSDTALAQADETLQDGYRATAALNAVAKKHHDKPEVEALLKNASGLVTCVEGKQWLNQHSKEISSGKDTPLDMDALQDEFAGACKEQTEAALAKSNDRIGKIGHELAETDLTLIPQRIADHPVFHSGSGHCVVYNWAAAYTNGPHLLGTLAMVVLLSLGAPFWFNALRQLSNLKPAISSKIEKESSPTKK